MPIYVWKCPEGHETEQLMFGRQPEDVRDCGTCELKASRVPYPGSVFRLAGGGWTPKHHLGVDDLPRYEDTQKAQDAKVARKR